MSRTIIVEAQEQIACPKCSHRFPLTEGHKGVECAKCHPGNVFENTPLQCGPKCHPDDLHKGTLGKDCLGCHTGGSGTGRGRSLALMNSARLSTEIRTAPWRPEEKRWVRIFPA